MLPPEFVMPSNSSSAPNMSTKYFALRATGGNISCMTLLGKSTPYASRSPYIAPDAPMVGVV